MKPISGVSSSLKYLVIGETPGESKIQKAKEASSKILDRNEFEKLDFSNNP
jgi:BRCT domain type II-containing protein